MFIVGQAIRKGQIQLLYINCQNYMLSFIYWVILMYLFKNPIGYIAYCAIAALYIIYLHRENIVRLAKGEENKVR